MKMHPKIIGSVIIEANEKGIKFPVKRSEAEKWRNVSTSKLNALGEMGLIVVDNPTSLEEAQRLYNQARKNAAKCKANLKAIRHSLKSES